MYINYNSLKAVGSTSGVRVSWSCAVSAGSQLVVWLLSISTSESKLNRCRVGPAPARSQGSAPTATSFGVNRRRNGRQLRRIVAAPRQKLAGAPQWSRWDGPHNRSDWWCRSQTDGFDGRRYISPSWRWQLFALDPNFIYASLRRLECRRERKIFQRYPPVFWVVCLALVKISFSVSIKYYRDKVLLFTQETTTQSDFRCVNFKWPSLVICCVQKLVFGKCWKNCGDWGVKF